MLKELLDDIVAKDVSHQAMGRGQNLIEDHLLLGRRGPFQLLLDEPGAMLVLRKLHHMVGQVT